MLKRVALTALSSFQLCQKKISRELCKKQTLEQDSAILRTRVILIHRDGRNGSHSSAARALMIVIAPR
jgi:hypothetical protein